MRLRQLEYLRLVLEKGSYAAAADAAGISQPAITQALQSLEGEFGHALFEKIGRKKVPTRAALAIARGAVDMNSTVAAMRRAVTDSNKSALDEGAPTLRVALSPTSARLYASTIERVWRSAEPGGVLHLIGGSAPEMLAGLAGDQLDLVIGPRPRGYHVAGVRRLRMYTSTPAVYCRKGHPLQYATSLAEIAGAAWAVSGQAGTPGNVIEEAHRVRAIRLPRVLVHCSDYPALLNLVAQTDLLCVIPHPILAQRDCPERVRMIRITEGLPQYEVSAFWKPSSKRLRGIHLHDILAALRALTALNT